MRRASAYWAVGTAGALSLALHLNAVGYFFGVDAIEIEGGALPGVARLGNDFADMVAATTSPDNPDPLEDVEPDQTAEPVEPEEQPETEPPEETPEAEPEQDTPAEPEPLEETPELATEAIPLPELTPSATPVALAPPEPELAPTVTPELEVVTGQAPVVVRTPDASTLRPQSRPDPNAAPPPPPPPQPVAQPAPQQPRPATPPPPSQASTGGDRDSRRGQDDGQESATATAASTNSAGQSAQAGNAAISNYPGRVWRRLGRIRRPRGVGRGEVAVGFRISASGGVASAWVAASSGNSALDQAAVQLVYRAAPFPAPPAGAQTQFTFQVEGR